MLFRDGLVAGRRVRVGRNGGLGDSLAGVDAEEAIVVVGVLLKELFVAETDVDGGELRKPKLVVVGAEANRTVVDGLVLEVEDVGDGAGQIRIEMKNLVRVAIDEGGALEKNVVRNLADAKLAHSVGDVRALFESNFINRKIVPIGDTFAGHAEFMHVNRMEDEDKGDRASRTDVSGKAGHARPAVSILFDGEKAVVHGLDNGDVADLRFGVLLKLAFAIAALELK